MSTPLTNHSPDEPDDLFTAWLQQTPGRPRMRGRRPHQQPGTIRFAFYGRMSTTEYRDAATSQQWQQDNAARVVAGHGTITVKYFDAGYSRSLPWHRRPAATNLLQHATDPERPFDAIVIGEYERAFTGQQAIQTIRHLNSHGITVWLPEANGPVVDLDQPAHQALLMMLGHQSEREVLRFRMRTTAAMCAQARDQGRHLGGRRLEGHWVHGRPGYRGRHGHTSSKQLGERPRSIYWPERRITTEMLHQLERQGAEPASGGVDGLVAHLCNQDAVIICHAAQLAIDNHIVEAVAKAAPTPPRPRIPAQRGKRQTPTASIPGRNESGGG